MRASKLALGNPPMPLNFEINKQTVNTIDDKIKIEINEEKSGTHLYAAYLLDARSTCIEKRNYQENSKFIFNNLPKGNYRIRIFKKNKKTGEKEIWGTKQINLLPRTKNKEPENQLNHLLTKESSKEKIKTFIQKNPAHLAEIFQLIRSKVHSKKITHSNSVNFSCACLELIDSSWLTPAQHAFLINSVLYTGSQKIIIDNSDLLAKSVNSAKNIPETDRNFLLGLLEYRIGNYFNAEKAFQKLLKPDRSLLFHQTGAPSYFYHLGDDILKTELKTKKIDILKKAKNNKKPLILMSCDYGYFIAYFEKTYNKLLKINTYLHIHVIKPREISNEEILKHIKHAEVGISIESENKEERENKNRKTYYATARYLILKEMLKTYQCSILISDIDIEYNKPFEENFFEIKNNEIALYNNKSFLPWTRIQAGFNLFGKDTFDSEFLTKLTLFLTFCLNTKRDGWMLDQTALEVVYQSCSIQQKCQIRPITERIGLLPKQYENRQSFRSTALAAIEGINRQVQG